MVNLMKLDTQITLLLQDPVVYYEYYYNHYRNTAELLTRMENGGCQHDHLIDLRIALADSMGRFSIARGVLADVPETVLINYWRVLSEKKSIIDGNIDRLEDFEMYANMISEKCRKNKCY